MGKRRTIKAFTRLRPSEGNTRVFDTKSRKTVVNAALTQHPDTALHRCAECGCYVHRPHTDTPLCPDCFMDIVQKHDAIYSRK